MQPPTVATYTNQQVAMATTVAAAVALCFWLIYRYNETLLLGVTGIIIAIAVRPLVRRLRRLGISQGLGVAIVYVLLLAGLLAFVLFGVPLIAAQATTIGERIQELYTEFYNLLLTTENFFLRRLLRTLP